MIGLLAITLIGAAPLDPLKPLLGNWTGTTEGASGKGTVTRKYEAVYGGKYIRFETTAKFPPKNGKPGEVHRDFGVFSYDSSAKAFSLREFHIEGFVNTYAQKSSVKGVFSFESTSIENIPSGFRAKTELKLKGKRQLEEVFSIAEPGKEYAIYSTVRLNRK